MKHSLAKGTISKSQVTILSEMTAQLAIEEVLPVILVKHGLIVNKEYRNNDFNIITDNETFAIKLELSDKQNITFGNYLLPKWKS